MNILSMLGLMKVEDHERAKLRISNGYAERVAEIEAERDDARRGFLNAQAKFVAAAKDLADQADELATFRAKRDRDNAQRRERHARKANDAAPKAKKGVRS